MLNYADGDLSKEGTICKRLSKKAIKSSDTLILAQNTEPEMSVLRYCFYVYII